MKNLASKLKLLPDGPGIYIFKDKSAKPIYVGKAKSLKKRVSSYFSKHPDSEKTAKMFFNAYDFECISTSSELEAYILENNFIKRHRPQYNIILKDDKQYPYIKLTVNEEWPRILLVRKIEADGAKYFGPYNGNTVNETIKLIKRLFPIRLCEETPLKARKQPCMYFYIKRCKGPCLGGFDHKAYIEMCNEIAGMLEGRLSEVVAKMKEEMKAAAGRLDFEGAKLLRDRIKSLSRMEEGQVVVSFDLSDRDVVSYFRQAGFCCAVVFKVRGGKLIERDIFYPKETTEASDEELMASILKQYYSDAANIPKEILTQVPIKERKDMESFLSKKRGSKVLILSPTRGDKFKLVQMSRDNAKLLLERKMLSLSGDKLQPALLELKKKLALKNLPIRIEAFDVSNIQGSDIVGAMVAFVAGAPLKKDYRKFKVSFEGKPDDTGAIYEIVSRRYSGSLKDKLDRPDLILIDGGAGQVSAAAKALKESGISAPPIIGLAKKFEEIYTSGSKHPLRLLRTSKALHLLQRIRDEVHRFAASYHRKRRAIRALTHPLSPSLLKKRGRTI
jgi:excinuclease ABC subunit C